MFTRTHYFTTTVIKGNEALSAAEHILLMCQ